MQISVPDDRIYGAHTLSDPQRSDTQYSFARIKPELPCSCPCVCRPARLHESTEVASRARTSSWLFEHVVYCEQSALESGEIQRSEDATCLAQDRGNILIAGGELCVHGISKSRSAPGVITTLRPTQLFLTTHPSTQRTAMYASEEYMYTLNSYLA